MLIPTTGEDGLQEVTKSKAGGLHADELHKYVTAYYTSSGDTLVRKQMSQRSDSGPEPFLESILDVPRPDNNYTATTMYSERNGLRVNERATSFARKCGHLSKMIYGDAFLARSFDRDDFPW